MEEPAGRKARQRRATAAQRLHDLAGGLDVPIVDWGDDAGPVIPLVLLPSQTRQEPEPCGCRRLLLAVLVDAFRRLASPPPGRPDLHDASRREVRQWFDQPDAAVTINLRDVCDGLNLDIGRAQAEARRILLRRAREG